MMHFRCLEDLDQIKSDPFLWRELYGFMKACEAEILEYADEADLEDHEFNVLLLGENERGYLEGLGCPEEKIETILRSSEPSRIIQLHVYPSEVIVFTI